MTDHSYEFLDTSFDPNQQTLSNAKCVIDLRPQLSDLLQFFIQRQGEVVLKEELFTAIWGDTIVSEDALFRAIRDLRKSLKSATGVSNLIRNIPKKGYVWEQETKVINTRDDVKDTKYSQPSSSFEVTLSRAPKRKKFVKPIGLLILTLCAVLILFKIWPQAAISENTPIRLAILPVENLTTDQEYAWIQAGLTDVVAKYFEQSQRLELVPLDTIQAVVDQRDSNVKLVNVLAETTGTSHVLATQLTRDQDVWRLVYTVYQTDKPMWSGESVGTSPMDVARDMTTKTLRELVPVQSPHMFEGVLSSNEYVNETYAKGVQKLEHEGPKQARPYFEICITQDPSFMWPHIRLSECLFQMGEPEACIKLLNDVILRANSVDNELLLAFALQERARRNCDFGDCQKGDNDLQRATEIYQRRKHHYGIYACKLVKAFGLFQSDKPDQALSAYVELLDQVVIFGDMHAQAKIHNNLGLMHYQLDRFSVARNHYQKGLELARHFGSRVTETTLLGNLAILDLDDGHYEDAVASLTRLKKMQFALENVGEEGWITLSLGLAQYYSGHYSQAERTLIEAQTILKKTHQQRLELFAWASIAYLQLFRGDSQAAATTLNQSRSIDIETDSDETRWFHVAVQAWLDAETGELDKAHQILATIPLEFSEADQPSQMISALVDHLSGDFKNALQHMQKAKEQQPASWQPGQDRWLATMQKSVEDGVAHPLPPLNQSY